MNVGAMVGVILTVAVAVIVTTAVLIPVITTATGEGGALASNTTWSTLATVCGTLVLIAIAMVAVRSLSKSKE